MRLVRAGLLSGLVLCTACACRRSSEPPQLVGAKEERVAVEAKTSDDLVGLYARYQGLLEQGKEAALDVRLAPGTYGPALVSMEPPTAQAESKIDVVIRGPGAGSPPAVLADVGLSVSARSLTLENLVITRRLQTLLKVKVRTGVVIRNCVFADNQQGAPYSQNLVEIGGAFGARPYGIDIVDTWFVRNTEASQSALLALSAAAGSFIDHVRFDNVLFAGNAFSADVAVMAARRIQISKLFLYETRGEAAGAGLAPAFLHFSTPQRATIDESTIIVDSLDSLAVEQKLGPDSVPLEVRSSRILVARGGATPPSLRVDGDQVKTSAVASEKAAEIRAALGEMGKSLPDEAGRKRLQQAFGL